MNARTPHRWGLLATLCAFFLAVAPLAQADLVWDAQRGWRVEGGALTLLTEEDNQRAIELMNEARQAQVGGNLLTAIRRYQRVADRFPRSIYAPEALYQIGQLRLQRRQYTSAFEAFDTVIRLYPAYGKFNDIIETQFRIARDLADGRRPYIFGWFPLLRNRDKGLEYFDTVVRNAPFAPTAAPALMAKGRGHERASQSDEAIDTYHRLIDGYSTHPIAPEAYLALAGAHAELVDGPRYDQGSTREALSYYQDFVTLFPASPLVAQAEKGQADMKTMLARSRIELGDWYFRYRSDFVAARVFYNEAITRFPDSPVAEEARRKLLEVDRAEEDLKKHPPSTAWRWIDWLWR